MKENKNIVIYNTNGKNINKHFNDTNDIVIFTEGKSDAEYLRKIFAENLKYYMDKNKKSKNDLSTDLQFKYSTVRDWVSGAKYPRMDKVQKLATYFNIKKSDLTELPKGSRDKVNIPTVSSDDIEYIEEWEDTFKILSKSNAKYFALTLNDKSMEYDYMYRDIIVFERTEKYNNRRHTCFYYK